MTTFNFLPQSVKDKMRAADKSRFMENRLNTPMSSWPQELKDYIAEKTRGIGISGGVITDLIEMYYDETH